MSDQAQFVAADLEGLLDVARAAARAGADVAVDWQRRGTLRVEEKTAAYDLVSQADRDSEAAVRAVLAERRPGDSILGEEAGASGDPSSPVTWVVDPIDGTTNYLYGLDQWAVSVAAVQTRTDGDAGPDGAPAAALGRVLAGTVLEPTVNRETYARAGGGTFCNGQPVRVRATADLRHCLIDIGFGSRGYRNHVGRLAQRLAFEMRDVRRGGSAATSLAMVATGRAEAYWGPGIAAWDIAAGVLLVTEAGGVVGNLDGPSGGFLPAGRTCLAAGNNVFGPLRDLLHDVYADD
ncbi:MAG: inositol monophosphatase [Actinomycetota bacterium]|nr:inositol monophosphatase [Actinomycetota bacterium]